MKIQQGHVIDIACQLARIMEKHREGQPTVVERSLQEGRRRKQAAQSLDRTLRVPELGFDTVRIGTIYKAAVKIMKYDSVAVKWEKAGWQSLRLGDWHTISNDIAEV